VVVIHPHIEVLTKDARAVLKNNIPLKTAVKQWANTAAFTTALFRGDYKLLGSAVVDYVAEPARSSLIPHFYKVKEAALQNGALACSISGACPSIFALCTENEKTIGRMMKKEFINSGIKSDVYISEVNIKGAIKL
jgi:homoserine kinase